jgi:hypothetical protein
MAREHAYSLSQTKRNKSFVCCKQWPLEGAPRRFPLPDESPSVGSQSTSAEQHKYNVAVVEGPDEGEYRRGPISFTLANWPELAMAAELKD